MAIFWVQGLRRSEELRRVFWNRITGGSIKDQWRVLMLRLLNRQNEIPSGRTTKRAEHGLGLRPSAYFYVARSHESFSLAPIAYLPPSPEEIVSAEIVPFDTGALFYGKLKVGSRNLTQREKRSYLEENSISFDDYVTRFQSWGRSAFDNSIEYVRGKEPHVAAADGMQMNEGDDPRHWTWEAHIPLSEFPNDSLRPAAVFLTQSERNQFQNWISRESGLSVAELTHVIRTLNTIHRCDEGTSIQPWLEAQDIW